MTSPLNLAPMIKSRCSKPAYQRNINTFFHLIDSPRFEFDQS